MHPREVAACLHHKMGDYRPVLPDVQLRLLRTEPYLEAAHEHVEVQEHLALGWYRDFEAEFHEAVLTDVEHRAVTACPPMLSRLVDDEPPRIQRAYVEGVFLRRLFRFLVAGVGWEAEEQIREIMARHFPFHLVTVESVEGSLALQ
jgi:hypothetical protein